MSAATADAADWAFARYPAEAEPANPYAEEDARYRLPPVRVAGIPLPPIHRAAFWLPSSEDAPVLLTLAVSAGAVAAFAGARGIYRAWKAAGPRTARP